MDELSGSTEAPPVTAGDARKSRPRLARIAVALVALLGVLLAVGVVAHFGIEAVGATLARLGWPGFAAFCAYTLGVFVLLGAAWGVLTPGSWPGVWPAYVAGRLMREAAADVLPFSQLGGFVFGARAATLLGAPAGMAVASSLVDLSTEMIGQLLFTVLGVALAWQGGHGGANGFIYPMFAVGFACALVIAAGFVATQRSGLGLITRLSARFARPLHDRLASVHTDVELIYRQPVRMAASILLHFSAWIAATGGVWLVLRFLGAPLGLEAVVAMESLIYLVRSAAFIVPGAVGVMESGYVLIGPAFGIAPEVALSLSLIKRGRDFAIGLPAVAVWQLLESGRLFRRTP